MTKDWAALMDRTQREADAFLAAAEAAHRCDWATVERRIREIPDPHRCGSMLDWYRPYISDPSATDDWAALEALLCAAAEDALIALKDLRARAARVSANAD